MRREEGGRGGGRAAGGGCPTRRRGGGGDDGRRTVEVVDVEKVPEYRVLIAIVAGVDVSRERASERGADVVVELPPKPASVTPILLTSPRGR